MSLLDAVARWMADYGKEEDPADEGGLASAHGAARLRRLAAKRGIRPEDVVAIGCTGCGATGDASAFGIFGFGHWPGCAAQDDQLKFQVRPSERRRSRG